tara:strand:+ start:406 stop:885 length:480 start_codon:yes stop_codon:yes gene_type:complete
MYSPELDNKAEIKFKEWLDKHNIPYLYINQEINTFSSVFKNKLKRPDFMILLPNFGFIFVDVKYKEINQEFGNFPIDANETKKFSSLQRKFNLQVWYVLSNEHYNYHTWFWIPISKVLESGIATRVSSKSKEDFFPIPPKEFIQISDNDSIDRLFSQSF